MNPSAGQTPIYLDQHALFVGTTGSGKSTRMIKELAWRLGQTRNIDPNSYKIVLVDTKPISYGQSDELGHYSFTGGRIYRDWKTIDLNNEESRLIIYRPTEDLVSPEEFDPFFDKILSYRRTVTRTAMVNGKPVTSTQASPLPVTLIIDELIDVFSSKDRRSEYMQGFTKFLTQGRSSLQTLWILTQYPTYIDPAIKRNVSANFVFELPDENDRRIMAGILGFKEITKAIPDQHGFWYRNSAIPATRRSPIYYSGAA